MSLIVSVKVIPSSGRSECIIDKKSAQLKCYLKSPPEQGKANAELIALFAKALKIPKEQIAILAGATGRKKMLKIVHDITLSDLLKALNIELQQTFLLK